MAVHQALKQGGRGLPGGSTLARLLEKHRGKRNIHNLPPFSITQILQWADAYHRSTDSWPTNRSGAIPGTPGDTWRQVDQALLTGLRSLPGGSSLPRLLADKRGVRNPKNLPRLSVQAILAWADRYHRRAGQWPKETGGPIVENPAETWHAVDRALRAGVRGLPGNSSLARLLAEHRGVRNIHCLPPFTIKQILAWADAYHARKGGWPYSYSGSIPEAPGETWLAVSASLKKGQRGLAGGTTLTRLLAEHRGMRNRLLPPSLSVKQILAWADAYHERTGLWPSNKAEVIPGTPGETWAAVDRGLRHGSRGLRGKSSLAQLILQQRGARRKGVAPPLTVTQILAWADSHYERTGQWPQETSGQIPDSGGETLSPFPKCLPI